MADFFQVSKRDFQVAFHGFFVGWFCVLFGFGLEMVTDRRRDIFVWGWKACRVGSKRPEEGDEEPEDKNRNDGEASADTDEIAEFVFAGAVNENAGRFEGGDEGDRSGEHDCDREGAFANTEFLGGSDSDREDDEGGGSVRHGLGEDDGEDHKSAEDAHGTERREVVSDLSGQEISGARVIHRGAKGGHSPDEDQETPIDEGVGAFDRDSFDKDTKNSGREKADGDRKDVESADDDSGDEGDQDGDASLGAERGEDMFFQESKVFADMETVDMFVGALDEESIAGAENGIGQSTGDGATLAVDGDNGKAVARAKFGLAKGFADDFGAGEDDGFREAEVGGFEVAFGKFSFWKEFDSFDDFDFAEVFDTTLDEDDIVFSEGERRVGAEVSGFTADFDDAEVEDREVGVADALTDERGVREDRDFRDIGAETERFDLVRGSVGREPFFAEEHHVGEAGEADEDTGGGDLKHTDRFEVIDGRDIAGDSDIGGGADEGASAAEDGCEGEGHQEFGGRDAGFSSHGRDGRKKESRGGGVVHEGRESCGERHGGEEEFVFACLGEAESPFA